jgi:hypothetical protein
MMLCRGCARQGKPGVYSRVSAPEVLKWIDGTICRSSCFPPQSCDSSIQHPCAQTSPSSIISETDYPQWPGKYYPDKNSNGIAINIHYDAHPEDVAWTWAKLSASKGNTNSQKKQWERKSGGSGGKRNELSYSYQDVDLSSLYRFKVADASADGTWSSGYGYFTINDATNVLWKKTGNEFSSDLEAYIWVNEKGKPQSVQRVPGIGYLLVIEQEKTDLGGSARIEVVVEDVP